MTLITKGMGAIIKGLKTPEKVAGKIFRTAKKEKKGVLIGIGAAAISDALLKVQNKKKDKKKSKDK
jgi:stage V sporulation protein SpoVS